MENMMTQTPPDFNIIIDYLTTLEDEIHNI